MKCHKCKIPFKQNQHMNIYYCPTQEIVTVCDSCHMEFYSWKKNIYCGYVNYKSSYEWRKPEYDL